MTWPSGTSASSSMMCRPSSGLRPQSSRKSTSMRMSSGPPTAASRAGKASTRHTSATRFMPRSRRRSSIGPSAISNECSLSRRVSLFRRHLLAVEDPASREVDLGDIAAGMLRELETASSDGGNDPIHILGAHERSKIARAVLEEAAQRRDPLGAKCPGDAGVEGQALDWNGQRAVAGDSDPLLECGVGIGQHGCDALRLPLEKRVKRASSVRSRLTRNPARHAMRSCRRGRAISFNARWRRYSLHGSSTSASGSMRRRIFSAIRSSRQTSSARTVPLRYSHCAATPARAIIP